MGTNHLQKISFCHECLDESGVGAAIDIATAKTQLERDLFICFKCLLTDDGANMGKARKYVRARFPEISVLRCQAHQFNLVAKEVTVIVDPKMRGKITGFLSLFGKKEIRQSFDAHLAKHNLKHRFVAFFDIRWNTMYLSTASVARARRYLRGWFNSGGYKLIKKYYKRNKNSCTYFGGNRGQREKKFMNFLKLCKKMSILLAPVAHANLVCLTNNKNMGDVVMCYLNVYNCFDHVADVKLRNKLCSVIERRWMKIEQPLFLLAMSLDIRYKHALNWTRAQLNSKFKYEQYNFDSNEIMTKNVDIDDMLSWAFVFYRERMMQIKLNDDEREEIEEAYRRAISVPPSTETKDLRNTFQYKPSSFWSKQVIKEA